MAGTNQATHSIVRLIALAIAAVAAFCLWMMLDLLVHDVLDHESIGLRLFGLSFELPLACISVWCLYVAYHGWFHRTATSVRRLCGVLALITYFFLSSLFDSYTQGPPPTVPRPSMVFFATPIAIAILFYLLTIGSLMRRLGLAEDRSPSEQRRHISRLFGYLAFLVLLICAEIGQSRLSKNIHSDLDPYLIPAVILLAGLTYLFGPRIYFRLFSSDSVSADNC